MIGGFELQPLLPALAVSAVEVALLFMWGLRGERLARWALLLSIWNAATPKREVAQDMIMLGSLLLVSEAVYYLLYIDEEDGL